MSGYHLIKLTWGLQTVVDEVDFIWLRRKKWYAWSPKPSLTYACTGQCVRMHRLVLNAKPGEITDYISRDTLDNRRCNLRIVSAAVSAVNKGDYVNNTSGIKGVKLEKRTGHWYAQINVFGRRIHLGVFDTLAEAACARYAAELKYHAPLKGSGE